MTYKKNLADHATTLLRTLPRISLSNIGYIPGTIKKNKRGRGDHGGNTHGFSKSGPKQHMLYPKVGYEGMHWRPFFLRFTYEPYYHRHHLKREYPPISLLQLQKMIDLNRLDIKKPIDLTTLYNTGLLKLNPEKFQYGFQLTEEGADVFKAKINLEVQWATEPAIAAIEKNGGTICNAFYDVKSLTILKEPKKFFEKGQAIPRRMIPPQDSIIFYTGAATRGYLANPEEISWERLVLSQKYGYTLPNIEEDPDYEMLTQRKDPRQIFYGLEPGWVVNLKDKVILKPKDENLLEFNKS